ncbi:hypothetical protein GCM10027299_33530 [Larkinella ripae]
MKIGLTSVFVHDPNAAFTFYTQTLGFLERMHVPEARLAIVVSPEDPAGTGLLLEPSDNPIGKSHQQALFQAGLPAIVFSTQNIQQDYERLTQAGVVFTKPPARTEWGLMATFDDTCGNLLQLHQLPSP